MKRTRFKRNLLLCGLLAFGGFSGWLTWRIVQRVHQTQLNQGLIAAIKRQDTDRAVEWLAAGAEANACDLPSENRSLWQQFRDRLRGHRPSVETAQTALLLAVEGVPGTGPQEENLRLVTALLNRGANVNARDETGRTALMSAAADGHTHTVKLLLNRGADTRPKDKDWTFFISSHSRTYPAKLWGRTDLPPII